MYSALNTAICSKVFRRARRIQSRFARMNGAVAQPKGIISRVIFMWLCIQVSRVHKDVVESRGMCSGVIVVGWGKADDWNQRQWVLGID